METERTFGYSYVGTPFRKVLRLTSSGIEFEGYGEAQWSDLVGYRAYPDFYHDLALAAVQSPRPRISLYFRDGRLRTLRGDLLVDDQHRSEERRYGIPQAFYDVVDLLKQRGVPKWQGPREEIVLFATAFTLMMFGFVVGTAVARVFFGSVELPLGIGAVAGVLLGQTAFVLAPLLARRLRRLYIDTL
jgi:hypothetical protein